MRWSEGDSAQDERGERGVAPQVAPSQRTGTSPHHTHTHSWRPNVCSGRHRPPHAPASSSQTQGQESSGMGGRQSTTAGTSRLSANNSPAHMYASTAGTAAGDGDEGRVRVTAVDVRPRTRSLSNVLTSSNGPSSSNGHHHHHQAHNHHPHHTHLHQPSLMSMAGLSFGLSSGSPDSDTSAEDMPSFGRVFSAHSLPVQPFLPFNGESGSPFRRPVSHVSVPLAQESSALSVPRPSYLTMSSAIWSCV